MFQFKQLTQVSTLKLSLLPSNTHQFYTLVSVYTDITQQGDGCKHLYCRCVLWCGDCSCYLRENLLKAGGDCI